MRWGPPAGLVRDPTRQWACGSVPQHVVLRPRVQVLDAEICPQDFDPQLVLNDVLRTIGSRFAPAALDGIIYYIRFASGCYVFILSDLPPDVIDLFYQICLWMLFIYSIRFASDNFY